MFSHSGFNSIKTAGVLFFLLTQASALYAGAADTVAAKSEANSDSVRQDQRQEYSFPRWPERHHIVKEEVPPPPPGPYMSLGLNDFPVSESAYDRDIGRPQIEVDPSGVPIQTFSPDIPWPKNIRPTTRWMPENGYQFVRRQDEERPDQAGQNYPAYNYGYQRYPDMGWSPPAGFYPYAPDYRSGYSNPASINHTQSANPSYGAPYPVPHKP